MKWICSIEEFQEMLSQVVDEMPQDFFKELSGGIVFVESQKMHPEAKPGKPLYIMGEYHRNVLGRQIKIYYGSFMRVYPHLSKQELYERLKSTVIHEFTHHLEQLAGLKGLEVKDAEQLKRYRGRG